MKIFSVFSSNHQPKAYISCLYTERDIAKASKSKFGENKHKKNIHRQLSLPLLTQES